MSLPTGLKINGVDMPSPLPYEINYETLNGNAGRSMDGKMKLDIIAQKVTVALSWGVLTEAEMRTILNATNPMIGGGFFQATIYSPDEGEVTKTFYVGSRKAPTLLKTSNEAFYNGLSFNIIER